MCLNGIQNILENELGAKCTNFIFLSEATIFLLRNEKNPFLTFCQIIFNFDVIGNDIFTSTFWCIEIQLTFDPIQFTFC